MSASRTIRDTDAMRVKRIRISHPKWSASRVLSGLGHPGYGDEFAKDVLDLVADGMDAFYAIRRAYHARGIQ